MWRAGLYNKIAFETVIANLLYSLNKQKGEAKYLEKPISMHEEPQEMSDEEKLRQTKNLFLMLQTMQDNFERNKKKNKDGGE